MQFGKRIFFFLLNGPVVLGLGIYFLIWVLGGERTTAAITRPLSNTLQIAYTVHGKTYTATHLRSGMPPGQETVGILYLRHKPSASRVASFLGLGAEPLGWWAVWLAASAMLLLTNNTVFSKGTRFKLQRRFPWVIMDEYFPAASQPAQTAKEKRGPTAIEPKRLRTK